MGFDPAGDGGVAVLVVSPAGGTGCSRAGGDEIVDVALGHEGLEAGQGDIPALPVESADRHYRLTGGQFEGGRRLGSECGRGPAGRAGIQPEGGGQGRAGGAAGGSPSHTGPPTHTSGARRSSGTCASAIGTDGGPDASRRRRPLRSGWWTTSESSSTVEPGPSDPAGAAASGVPTGGDGAAEPASSSAGGN